MCDMFCSLNKTLPHQTLESTGNNGIYKVQEYIFCVLSIDLFFGNVEMVCGNIVRGHHQMSSNCQQSVVIMTNQLSDLHLCLPYVIWGFGNNDHGVKVTVCHNNHVYIVLWI